MALYDALQKRLKKGTTPLLAEAGKADVGTATAAIQAAAGGKSGGTAAATPSLAEQAAAAGAATDVTQAASQNALQAQALGMAEQQEAVSTAQSEAALSQQLAQGQQALAAQATTQRENVGQAERLGLDRLHSNEEIKRQSITSQAESAIANLLSNKKIQENDIFSSFAQDERELSFRRDAAAIEQVGTMLALRDRAYVDELSRVGAVRNLDNEQNFQKESARLALGDQLALYLDKLKWSEADLTDNLRFAEKIAQMDIDQAWAILKMSAEANNSAMIASGATAAATAGVQYVANQPSAPIKVESASPNTVAYDASKGNA